MSSADSTMTFKMKKKKSRQCLSSFIKPKVFLIFALLCITCLLLWFSDYYTKDGLNWHYPMNSYSVANFETEWLCFYHQSMVNLLTPFCWAKEFLDILRDNPSLTVIEPHLLSETLVKQQFTNGNQTLTQARGDLADLKWRFDLPQKFDWKNNCLTVGVMAEDLNLNQLRMGRFLESFRVVGENVPFAELPQYKNQSNVTLHVFYERTSLFPNGVTLYLHLVIFYRVKHFFWVGAIPDEIKTSLVSTDVMSRLHFGKYSQIYDPFRVKTLEDGITYPKHIDHFLSQLSTDRYLHCPAERTVQWFRQYNVKFNFNKIKASKSGFVGMKRLMRKLRMQFWIACGTLLGWYRQCQITPYTSDTDFATWAKYLPLYPDLASTFLDEAPLHSMQLLKRFGEPSTSMEIALKGSKYTERFDLFFMYTNETHFRMPVHLVKKHVYFHAIYPKHRLCSIALLGYKLLAPCEPEKIIVTEYGENWHKPISGWSYFRSPKNLGPFLRFNFSVEHVEYFD